jgi:hypothetical protein
MENAAIMTRLVNENMNVLRGDNDIAPLLPVELGALALALAPAPALAPVETAPVPLICSARLWNAAKLFGPDSTALIENTIPSPQCPV